MDGFVVVAKRPDGSDAGTYGSSEGMPFGSEEDAEEVAADPGKHLEPDWECTVHRIIGLPE